MSARNITVIRHSRFVTVPLLANAVVRKGEIVFRVTASGFAKGLDIAAGSTGIGIAYTDADNTGGANGDKSITVEQGDFLLRNAGTNTVVAKDVGGTCYGETAETSTVEGAVGNDSVGKSPVGTVINIGYSGETGVVVRIES